MLLTDRQRNKLTNPDHYITSAGGGKEMGADRNKLYALWLHGKLNKSANIYGLKCCKESFHTENIFPGEKTNKIQTGGSSI